MRTATAKVFMLPTTGTSIMYQNQDDNKLAIGAETTSIFPQHINQHIYFTIDEQPKVGDYWLNTINPTCGGVKQATEYDVDVIKRTNAKHCQKVVATSDKTLWYDLDKPTTRGLHEMKIMDGDDETLKNNVNRSLWYEPTYMKRIHNSFMFVYADFVNRKETITEVELEVEDVLIDPSEWDEKGNQTKVVIKSRPSDNTVIVHEAKKITKADMRKEIIAFAKWYSGMSEEKVERAYERYIKELTNVI